MDSKLEEFAQLLREGKLIACPTEGVWGLHCDPLNSHAVKQLFKLKQRAADKGLILVGSSLQQFDWFIVPLNASQQQQVEVEAEYPITWLVSSKQQVPEWVTGKHPNQTLRQVAIRITKHPQLKALCQAYGSPLVSTSANPASLMPALNQQDVHDYFGNEVVIIPGNIQSNLQGASSEIRNLSSGQVIRPFTPLA